MALDNRPVIANQKQADLFISIHANALPNTKFSGIETFYLNFSSDPKVNEIAARENATSTKNIGEMTEIIKKIVRNSKIVESKELAKRIQKHLVKRLSQKYSGIKSLGVKGGPFLNLQTYKDSGIFFQSLEIDGEKFYPNGVYYT